jgi:hypothetical protein
MKPTDAIVLACAALAIGCQCGRAQVDLITPGSRENPSSPTRHVDQSGFPGDPVYKARLAGSRAAKLKPALGLTAEQAREIELIITQEEFDLDALGPVPARTTMRPIQLRAREQIRSLLSADQRLKFNLIPLKFGGGLLGKSPWEHLDRLDKLVHLAPARKGPVLDELIAWTEDRMEGAAPDQASQAQEDRLMVREQIRALLTPRQRQLLDAALDGHRRKSGDAGNS